MSQKVTRRTVLAGTGAAALVSASGVSLADQHKDDEDDDTEDMDEGEGPEFAAVNTVHASPDAPNVDVYVNGARVLEDVAFRDISDYLALLEGEYTVQIVPVEGADGAGDGNGIGDGDGAGNGTGTDDDSGMGDGDGADNGTGTDDDSGVGDGDGADNGTGTDDGNGMASDDGAGGDTDPTEDAVLDQNIEVPAGVATAAVIGEAAEDAEQELELSILEVDLSELEDGQSRVRAVHASPDAPEVDIYADNNALVEGLAFGDSETFEVEEGEYTLEVREAGQDESVSDFDVTLDAGVVYSAFAVGFLEEQDGDSGGIGDSEDNGTDSAGAGDSEDNGTDSAGAGDSGGNGTDSAGVSEPDTGFDLLVSVSALTPSADVEATADDDGDIGGDDENGGIGDDDSGAGSDDDSGAGSDDEDGASDDSSSL